ncbi:YihY/virulence factor BrkB family protein [Sphingomonas sp. Leaf257]|jgi:membrane protein|uniref:YihY/virulence factor BrkB family protein n=1 Tax=Sphingomonas sp. Leaf257 TaxID=1736309 RepID=UPI0009E6E0E1|nr:YihY/virulence factor BrkB family protein [Sphingomonas sp. Leaf257]
MTAPKARAGRGARSPLEVPANGWLAIAQRTWKEMDEDNIGIIAAGIAFYVFAAIVPTLGAVVLSYGLFADAETVRQNVEAVFASLPRDAASIITDQLLTVSDSAKDKQGIGLIIALALAWYGATKGSSAIITGLNVAYDTEETRGFVRINLLRLGIVAGGVLMIFLAVGTTTLLAFLGGLVPDAPGVMLVIIRIAGYLVLALLVVTASAVLFRYGPDNRQPRWVWLSPGSIGATLLWLAGTAAFGFYVSRFGNYGATYGSLSAVIVTLTWLWLTAYVFLLGAELNAELERQVEGEPVAGQFVNDDRTDLSSNRASLATPKDEGFEAVKPGSISVAPREGRREAHMGSGMQGNTRLLTLAVVAVAAFATWRRGGRTVAGRH